MPLEHNFDQFAQALSEAPEEFNEEVLTPLARNVDVWFGRTATREYMQGTDATFEGEPAPRPQGMTGPLRRVSNRLANAVRSTFKDITGRGGARESRTLIAPKESGILWSKIITVPYAAIHEFGGRIPTTPQMESFFWAKAFETTEGSVIPDSNRWKQLALGARSNSFFVIPARPYAGPALEDITPRAINRGEELIQNFLDERIGSE